MKKLINVLLAACFVLFTTSFTVFAEENEDEWGYTNYMSEEFRAAYNEAQRMLLLGIQPYALTKLAITRLAQNSSSWGSSGYGDGCSDSIGTSGCALTSITMIYNGLYSVKETPVTMNDKIKEAGGFSGCNMVWANLENSPVNLKLEASIATTSIDKAFTAIAAAINKENYVLLQVKNSSGGNHYAVAYGFNTEGKIIYIADPGGYNYATLNAAIDAGWSLVGYRVVNKAQGL